MSGGQRNYWINTQSIFLTLSFPAPLVSGDSREAFPTATEKYPWQNPWYKDYGKFRKNRKNNDPVFDLNMVTNVTAQLGGTAFLHCRVKNLGERPVSSPLHNIL